MTNLRPLLSSDKDDWQTPDNILDIVRQVAPIYFDPCTTNENPTGASVFCVPQSLAAGNFSAGLRQIDGLASSWGRSRHLIYCNPPYGRQIGQWIRKCTDAGRDNTVIALVPARTDARWFQDAAPDAICFWAGRLTFRGAPSAAPFPSALLFWGKGDYLSHFLNVLRPKGLIWTAAGSRLGPHPCGCRIETLTYICNQHVQNWAKETTDAEEGDTVAEG